MIAPKKILPVFIFFIPPRDLGVIALTQGQRKRYTFLPESRREVKQNMELHGFTGFESCGMMLQDLVDGGPWYAILKTRTSQADHYDETG
jgi:hypothetical protein